MGSRLELQEAPSTSCQPQLLLLLLPRLQVVPATQTPDGAGHLSVTSSTFFFFGTQVSKHFPKDTEAIFLRQETKTWRQNTLPKVTPQIRASQELNTGLAP